MLHALCPPLRRWTATAIEELVYPPVSEKGVLHSMLLFYYTTILLYYLCMLCSLLAPAQMASRAIGELVRKLGERVLPSVIPILSLGLKNPNPSTRQVGDRTLQYCNVVLYGMVVP